MSVLVVVGASFRTAPIEVRERLALTARATAASSRASRKPPTADEAIAVSTCNRTELYLVGHDAARLAEVGIAELRAIAGEHDLVADDAFFVYRGERAAQHVYRVAAGLDAVVKGEAEVLGQVREALALARVERTAGPILSRLFESAIETARRVRNETAVGRTAVSVGSIAAGLADQTLGQLAGATVLVIGAGQTAELVVTSLVARGAGSVRVVNRTVDRAHDLAHRFGGTVGTIDRLEQELAAADVVVSATHAPHHLVTPELVGDRSGRPLLAIDLAVPRDIDPAVRAPARRRAVRHRRAGVGRCPQPLGPRRRGRCRRGDRRRARRRVPALADALDVVPAITGLRALAEVIRREELDRVSGRFESLTPRDRAVVEQLTRSIVNKLLHEPTVRMKDGPELAQTVRDLFDLETVTPVRIGTRASRLAMAQAELAATALRGLGHAVAIVPLSTQGDRDRRRTFAEIGGRGIFAAEIEEALRDGRVDVAVHSAKDLTGDEAVGLAFGACLERADPRDAWVGPARSWAEVPDGARVATASLRRSVAAPAPAAGSPDRARARQRRHAPAQAHRTRPGRRDPRRRRPRPARPRRRDRVPDRPARDAARVGPGHRRAAGAGRRGGARGGGRSRAERPRRSPPSGPSRGRWQAGARCRWRRTRRRSATAAGGCWRTPTATA